MREDARVNSLDSARTVPAARLSLARGEILGLLAGRYRFVPVLLAIALVWAIFYAANENFLTARNLTNLVGQIVVTAVLALGLVLILVIKEIDLSISAASAVSAAVMAALLVLVGLPAPAAIAGALVTGAVIGLLQGLVITRLRAPSFIVTLGTSLALQGVLLMLLPRSGSIPLAATPVQGIANSYLPAWAGFALVALAVAAVAVLSLQSARHRRLVGAPALPSPRVWGPATVVTLVGLAVVAVLNQHRGVPTPVALLVLLLAAMFYVTTQTRFGTYLYAIGGNAEAARRSGIPVQRIRLAAFTLAGALAAVAGILAASRTLGVSTQSGGGTLLLEAVAAAVIGGASLFGGRGSVWAALLGALLIGSISNGLSLVSAPTEVKYLVQGFVLVLAVTVDSLLAREGAKP
jgi:D-xylose transport system permease protein